MYHVTYNELSDMKSHVSILPVLTEYNRYGTYYTVLYVRTTRGLWAVPGVWRALLRRS